MDTLSYKTVSANKETASKGWVIIDAEDQILGRLATATAMILRGKNKPSFTPHADCGDNVVIVNAEKIRLTGNKMDDKEYISHSGYPGGQRRITPRKLMAKKPTAVVENAVRGMLPKNRLGRALFRNMFVYAGPEHKQEAQKPREVKLNEIK
jgi:large subunit ribosomal protein L13